MTKERWYAASMDEAAGEFESKKAAIDLLTTMHLDGRKRPVVKRIGGGAYEYHPPQSDSDGTYATYVIGPKEAMEAHGFSWLFEKDQEGAVTND